MFKLQSPSKYSPSDGTHLCRHFFHCSKQFLNSLIFMSFSTSYFCFTSSTWEKHFPLRTFFIRTNKKRSVGVRSGEQRGWGTRVMLFLVKNCWTLSAVWAGELVTHPFGKWANVLNESSKKKFHWSPVQPLTATSASALTQMGSYNSQLRGRHIL